MEIILNDQSRESLKEVIKEAMGEFFQEAQQKVVEEALISTMPPDLAIMEVGNASSLEELQELEEDERGRRDEGRPGVLDAIRVRRAEL